jgi:hypothetical protein
MQALSGNRGASFDRNRVSNNFIALGQQAAPQRIDTACHGVRSVAGTDVCPADARVLVSFHI